MSQSFDAKERLVEDFIKTISHIDDKPFDKLKMRSKQLFTRQEEWSTKIFIPLRDFHKFFESISRNIAESLESSSRFISVCSTNCSCLLKLSINLIYCRNRYFQIPSYVQKTTASDFQDHLLKQGNRRKKYQNE